MTCGECFNFKPFRLLSGKGFMTTGKCDFSIIAAFHKSRKACKWQIKQRKINKMGKKE